MIQTVAHNTADRGREDAPTLDALLDRWDRLARAIDKTVCALPQKMSAAVEALETERQAFRAALEQFSRNPTQ